MLRRDSFYRGPPYSGRPAASAACGSCRRLNRVGAHNQRVGDGEDLIDRQCCDPLRQWLTTVPVRSWSPGNDRVQSLWKTLTDDMITQAPSWSADKKGVKRRHDFPHSASPVSRDEAEAFVDAGEQLVEHMAQVMADTFPDPVEG